jgi:hypothetical protein
MHCKFWVRKLKVIAGLLAKKKTAIRFAFFNTSWLRHLMRYQINLLNNVHKTFACHYFNY